MAVAARKSFSGAYAHWLPMRAALREDTMRVSEHVVQCLWYDTLFRSDALRTLEGHQLRIISPGWWNQLDGPDFRGAQIEFNGRPFNGDVEIHLYPSAWNEHGHQHDPRYDDVILHVVLDGAEGARVLNSRGRAIPNLVLRPFLQDDLGALAASLDLSAYPHEATPTLGRCAAFAQDGRQEVVVEFLRLAAEWRMLNKAHTLRQRMEQAGADQAIYELFLYACGFSEFKDHFGALARALPYERARQLALADPLLLEAAFFQVAGLLPAENPEESAPPHLRRMRSLREEHLPGLRPLPLNWHRGRVRPVNFPERRLAGAARFLARTSAAGLTNTFERLWREECSALQRRRSLEGLFPRPMGFWASHCTWTSVEMAPVALLGAGRVRSIIGNVFIPVALAMARSLRDREREERVLELFAALPREQDNRITKIMLPRLGLNLPPRALNFQLQQGLLQMHQDWCEPNPSCRNCSVLRYLHAAGGPSLPNQAPRK